MPGGGVDEARRGRRGEAEGEEEEMGAIGRNVAPSGPTRAREPPSGPRPRPTPGREPPPGPRADAGPFQAGRRIRFAPHQIRAQPGAGLVRACAGSRGPGPVGLAVLIHDRSQTLARGYESPGAISVSASARSPLCIHLSRSGRRRFSRRPSRDTCVCFIRVE